MTAAMSDGIAAAVEGAAARDDVRVVLLAGAGTAFCSGADLSGADAHENFDVTSLDRANRIIRAIVGLGKPCVAAVNGSPRGWAARSPWPATWWWRGSPPRSCWRSRGSA